MLDGPLFYYINTFSRLIHKRLVLHILSGTFDGRIRFYKSLLLTLNKNRLTGGDIFCASAERLSCCMLFSKVGNNLKMVRGGQSVIWQRIMNAINGQAGVCAVRLPSRCPRNLQVLTHLDVPSIIIV